MPWLYSPDNYPPYMDEHGNVDPEKVREVRHAYFELVRKTKRKNRGKLPPPPPPVYQYPDGESITVVD